MLLIKITDDFDVFNNKIIKMNIKPDFDPKNQNLLNSMGFNWVKFERCYTKLTTNKQEVRAIIRYLQNNHKDYVLEHVKVIKRKRSGSLDKIVNKLVK